MKRAGMDLERTMSLQGTFNTSVQAMLSQSQMMSNISTNIANVNTTAYKLQDTHFATLLNHTSPGTPSPKSFFSVNTYDYRQVDKQGTIATTNRTFDLAINGRGFFVTNGSTEATIANDPDRDRWQYTRDGALFGKSVNVPGSDLDGDGQDDREDTYLITADGSYVYGWRADENGNFDESNSLTSLQPVVYRSGVAYTDDINSIGRSDPSLPPSGIPAKATTLVSIQANLSASDEGRQNVGVPFVDSQGNSRTLTIGFTAGMGSTWTLDMSSVSIDNQPVDVVFNTDDPNNQPVINFDGTGNLIYDHTDPAGGLLRVEMANADEAPQSFTVDIRKMTQFADGNKLTVRNIDHDGYIAGQLNNTYFNSNGVLIGSYSNGEVRNLYKLPIATFAADQNLEAKNGNTFIRRPEAGDLVLSGLGKPTGTTHIVAGALEASNVDLADQFSKMIVTQRAYSSAAKVLSTADEMTMAARDLKR